MNKKGLIGAAKISFFLVLLTFSIFFIYTIIPTIAAEGNGGNPGAIWTTRDDCGDEKQDVNHYYIGEHVFINGANFDSGDHYWEITGRPGHASCDPGQIVASGTQIVDESGSFCFDAYTVQPDDCGEYQVKFGVKGDNYRVIEVNVTCEDYTNESDCVEDPDCDWCPLCGYFETPTKVNQWLEAKCVPKETDCGWHCEIDYCGATCSENTDCECPQDECIGPDYYDYPDYGECVDCEISCYCEDGIEQGEPCEPTIYYDDPRCGECTTDEDCDDDNVCTIDECIDNYCSYTPKPLSTYCELDDNLCTVDHCDGLGSCVKDYDVDCSDLDNQCQKGLCNQSDGQCYPNYFDYSTTCDNDLYCDGPDHCDGLGTCVNLGPSINCSHLNDQCQEGICDEDLDECITDYTNYPFCTTCEADEDPCTLDHCDGEGSCVVYDYIDEPSIPNKTVGEPKVVCEESDWCDYKITISTPITLSCENGRVLWRYALDGEWGEWHNETSPVTIYFPEECNHTLETYCEGVCGESQVDSENFKVEGTKFEIPLFKKWNLISVPFVLLDDNVTEVFKDIKDSIEAVWAYQEGIWYIWTPGEAPDDLETIDPGWGYWVLTKNTTEEPLWLIIGGSLFSPTITPPEKDLINGWNLIGYYGTDWQDYLDGYDSCGYYYEFGNYVYCALNSLIDTQEGYPRWSSLMGYDNCGDHVANWVSLNTCDNIYAGKGYWIEMDINDTYAPATTCVWNENFICVEE